MFPANHLDEIDSTIDVVHQLLAVLEQSTIFFFVQYLSGISPTIPSPVVIAGGAYTHGEAILADYPDIFGALSDTVGD